MPGRPDTGPSRPTTDHPARSQPQRGMVTVELAVGVLAACLVAALLGWGIGLIGLQARCGESASQIARQLGRDDQQAADEARLRVPDGAEVRVTSGNTTVEVLVTAQASWGRLGPVTVQGRATAPTRGR